MKNIFSRSVCTSNKDRYSDLIYLEYHNDPKFSDRHRSEQTVKIQIRLLLKEQSDQGLHCLLSHWHLFDGIPLGLASLFEI